MISYYKEMFAIEPYLNKATRKSFAELAVLHPSKCSFTLSLPSSHGKPGKVMEFNFLFPGVEKSWNLTPGFGRLIKVMEIRRYPLIPLANNIYMHGLVPPQLNTGIKVCSAGK